MNHACVRKNLNKTFRNIFRRYSKIPVDTRVHFVDRMFSAPVHGQSAGDLHGGFSYRYLLATAVATCRHSCSPVREQPGTEQEHGIPDHDSTVSRVSQYQPSEVTSDEVLTVTSPMMGSETTASGGSDTDTGTASDHVGFRP